MNTAILSNDLLGIFMLSFYPTPSQQDTNIYRIFHSIRWTFYAGGIMVVIMKLLFGGRVIKAWCSLNLFSVACTENVFVENKFVLLMVKR
jgi:hypothetical protein